MDVEMKDIMQKIFINTSAKKCFVCNKPSKQRLVIDVLCDDVSEQYPLPFGFCDKHAKMQNNLITLEKVVK